MTRDNTYKINRLVTRLPRGSVLTTAWLKKQGISNKLAWWYVKSGWFEHIGDGAYFLSGDAITWASAIYSIQQQLDMPIHVGAKTALQLLGKSHFLSAKLTQIQLFSLPDLKLPAWMSSSYWDESFSLYATSLLNMNDDTLIQFPMSELALTLSSPERAAIEICYLVPKAITFSEAALIIEGLSRLRPKVVQALLENCQSLKTKRLFLYLSDYFQHQWLSDINVDRIDLGKGKYVIAGGGRYDAKYKISVPIIQGVSE